MKDSISVEYIKDIFSNMLNIEVSESDLNRYGEPEASGSYEFELIDKDNRLWGGRMVKVGNMYEVVEVFPKIFYADLSQTQLLQFKGNIENQQIDEFYDL